MIAFTISANNFLAQVQVLHDGIRRHYPDVVFYAVICDQVSDLDRDAFPFEVLELGDIAIPDIDGMIDRYNITELNTSIKPFVFLHLFDLHPGRPVVYFDPDIAVFSPLVELDALLGEGADCVLTPHLCEPAEFAEMNEGRILLFGVYNLGFLALRDTEQVRRVVAWWGRRLEQECVIDLPSGRFVDQRWADLFPAFINRTAVLRHPGYNVAYWNLSQRTVKFANGDWTVNGLPLRFFHFSGSSVDGTVFSRHSGEYRLDTIRDVARLFNEYVGELDQFGKSYYRSAAYAFSWDSSAGPNLHAQVTEGSRWNTIEGSVGGNGVVPHLPVLRARTLDEYQHALARMTNIIRRRRDVEERLIPYDSEVFKIKGYCVVCGKARTLNCGMMYSNSSLLDGRQVPNWREHLDCEACGFTNRLRACLHLLGQEVRPESADEIYMTEQVTPLYSWFARQYPSVTGSEYLGSNSPPGTVVDGVRHEDLQQLSFPDDSFDLIVSFEVLEHVPDAAAALSELARCLRPGGTLFLTAPFRDTAPENEVRAVLADDGAITHFLPPEIHGNPIDPANGALCFRYFGWQLLDDLRAVGFAETEVWFYWSRRYGYLGDTNSVIVARR
ncbi:MAG TPA: methyltransferase domain-containing protein [Thermoanaerobaculia bacterium]|nr:methyltransferase domain-containing protein [Thermoanaerobaculia bacterium]